MNAQMLLENLGLIVNAMDGINRIRDVVLSLAFQGKLAKHSSIHVDDLLTSIDELEPRSKRRQRSLTDAVIGYHSIPSHWRWVTMDQIGHDWGQTKPISDFTYIDVSSIDNKRGVISESPKIITAATAPSRARKSIKKGTVIYSTVRPYLRNIAVVDKDFEPEPIASTAFAILHPFEGIEAKYIYYYLRSPAFVSYVESVQSGIAYPAISDQKFFASLLPLAPTEEQKRIVAKVDELMALCDKLEAQQQERERRFPVLSRACHARFVEALTMANLKAIFDEAGSISTEDLRKTVLDLAIQGKLNTQNPYDESACFLLKRIQDEKRECIDSGLIKNDRASFSSALNEPYKLPKNWQWVELKDIFIVITDGDHQPPPKSPSGVPFLVISNVRSGILDFSDTRYVTADYYDSLDPIRRPMPGDILYTLVGSYGIPVLVADERRFCVQRHIGILKPSKQISAKFVANMLSTQLIFEQATTYATGIAQKTVSLKGLRRIRMPLPPLAEQHRIVAKVNQLMALIDKLEEQQARKAKIAQAFAQAAVSAITGTEIKEPEKMKAPKTELVSRLQTRNTPNAADPAPLTKLLTEHNGELPAKSLWQRSGLEIDAFYQQLRTEMANGWIIEPEKAVMKEIEAD